MLVNFYTAADTYSCYFQNHKYFFPIFYICWYNYSWNPHLVLYQIFAREGPDKQLGSALRAEAFLLSGEDGKHPDLQRSCTSGVRIELWSADKGECALGAKHLRDRQRRKTSVCRDRTGTHSAPGLRCGIVGRSGGRE